MLEDAVVEPVITPAVPTPVIDVMDASITDEGESHVLIVTGWDTGDTKHEWNPNNSEEVEIARKTFMEMKAKGWLAYRVDPKSDAKGEVIKEFDPKAGKIIMGPSFKGG